MLDKKNLTLSIARTAITAALYAAITILLAPISYGAVQFRVSEALTLLPLLFPEAVWGLTLGCLIANLYSGWWADAVFGTLATAIAALLTYFIGKRLKKRYAPCIAALPPVLINAIVLPLIWLLFTDSGAAYIVNFATVLLGQTGAVYLIGLPVYYLLKRTKLFKK